MFDDSKRNLSIRFRFCSLRLSRLADADVAAATRASSARSARRSTFDNTVNVVSLIRNKYEQTRNYRATTRAQWPCNRLRMRPRMRISRRRLHRWYAMIIRMLRRCSESTFACWFAFVGSAVDRRGERESGGARRRRFESRRIEIDHVICVFACVLTIFGCRRRCSNIWYVRAIAEFVL